MVKNVGIVLLLVHHYDLTHLVLYVNGFQHPSEPLIMDCYLPLGATRAYESLFSSTGIYHVDRAHMITLEIFTNGFCVLGFDLTSNSEADKEDIFLPCQGKLGIEAHVKKQLPEPITCIFMLNFLDISRSKTPERLQQNEYPSSQWSFN